MKVQNILVAGALGAASILAVADPAAARTTTVITRSATTGHVAPGHTYSVTRYRTYGYGNPYRYGYAYPYAYGYPYGAGAYGVSVGVGYAGGGYGYPGTGYGYPGGGYGYVGAGYGYAAPVPVVVRRRVYHPWRRYGRLY
jgi:hypothetical protein